MTYFWLSFVDPKRRAGKRFQGGCLIEADSPAEALLQTHVRKINPGGAVQMIEIGAKYEAGMLDKFQLNHLYSKAEIRAMGEYRTMEQAIEDGDVTDG